MPISISRLKAVAKTILPRAVVNFIRYERLLRAEMRAGEPELRLIPKTFDRKRIAVDIGANVGMVTYLLRRYASKVLAVEPNPALAERLRVAFPGPEVEVLPYAMSDTSGYAELIIPNVDGQELTGRSSLEPTANGDLATRRIVVPRRTLDALSLRGVGFVKVDVEGHELKVLHGGENLLTQQRPSLMIEAEDKFGEGLTDSIFRLLGEHDYLGVYLWKDRLHDVSTFRTDAHQPLDRAKRINEPADPSYIRNFIFVHKSNAAALERLEVAEAPAFARRRITADGPRQEILVRR